MTTTTNGSQVRYVNDCVALQLDDIKQIVAKLGNIYEVITCSDDKDRIYAQGDKVWAIARQLEKLSGVDVL